MSTTAREGSGWRLTGGELTEWLAGLMREGKRLIAPVEESGLRLFRTLQSVEQICFAPGKTYPRDRLVLTFPVACLFWVRGR